MVDGAVPTGDRVQLSLTAGLLVLAVALGGGQGGLGDTCVQLLALLLLAYLFAGSNGIRQQLQSLPKLAWLPLAVLLIPLLQMIPLPGSSWGGVEGRAAVLSQLASVGLDSHSRIALQDFGPERALWGLLPALALYLSTLTLGARSQRQITGLVLLLAFLALVLGLMQVAGGRDSALYFYANTNRGAAVGFFANRNHLAALLLMALPMCMATVAYVISERGNGKKIGLFAVVAAIGLAILLILGLALTRSRAGLLLGMLGLLLSVPMLFAIRRQRGVRRIFAFIVAAALVLTVQFALFGILQRLQTDPLDDQRWQIAHTTIEAARLNAPLGSGLGTFRQVFQAQDTKAPGHAIVNHAHDDYLELWLEAGWPFFAVAAVFVGLILWKGIVAWRSSDPRHALWARAASISLLLMLLHSALDYPLRTTGNQAVFAVLLAILLSWRWVSVRSDDRRRIRAERSGPRLVLEEETR